MGLSPMGRSFKLKILLCLIGLSIKPTIQATEYAIGVDVSYLKQAEDHGTAFKVNNQAQPGLKIFRDHGYNWIRLRIFHNPLAHHHPKPNDLNYTIALAQQAKKYGYKFLLDFHYSDTWADPLYQVAPKAWQGKSPEEVEKLIFSYTRDTLVAFRQADAAPDMVQLGNEIIIGLAHPYGVIPENWRGFTNLLKAAARGVEAASENTAKPRIMLHIDRGGDLGKTRWFFDQINQYGVPYDVIGQSFYPFWHGSLDDLRQNLKFMAETYGKDIMVVEAGYNWRPAEYINKPAPFPETPEGQRDFLKAVNRIVQETPQGKGIGIFWWEPAVGLNDPDLRSRGYFDDEGNALPIIEVFKKKN